MDSQTRHAVEHWMQRRFELSQAKPRNALAFVHATAELVELLRLYDPPYAYALNAEIIPLLAHLPDNERPRATLTLHLQLGQSAYRLGKQPLATHHLRATIEIVQAHPELGSDIVRAHICHLQGGLDTAHGRYDQAFQALLQALRFSQAANDRPKQVSILLTLSSYYGRIKRPDRAMEVLNHALQIDSQQKAHPHVQILIYNNLAWAYHDSGNTDEALRLLEIGIGLAHAHEHRIGIGITHATLGQLLNSRRAYLEANDHFQRAYALLHQAGYQAGEVKLLMGWAVAQWGLDDSDTAIATLEKALLLADADKIMRAECCELLAKYHDALGDAPQALAYFREYHALEKAIFNLESQERIARMESLYRTQIAEQEAELYRLRTVELEEKVQQAQLEMLERLALAGEKGSDTAAHSQRVCWLAGLVARQLGLSDAEATDIELATKLHDIGKIAIPDQILTKPTTLAPDEFELVKAHTTIGAEILSQSDWPLLKLAETIALSHHERWDGSGYPRKLRGEEIPLAGRIVAVVDVFDVLISNRPYKQSWLPDEAITAIRARSGTHFDPAVVEAFCDVVLVQVLQT
jgi:HD-GYP domain-containing protein (c-di-GMP phosphodiesterase class II)